MRLWMCAIILIISGQHALASACDDIDGPIGSVITLKQCINDLRSQLASLREEVDVQYSYIRSVDEDVSFSSINSEYNTCKMFNLAFSEIAKLKGMETFKPRDCDGEKSLVMKAYKKK